MNIIEPYAKMLPLPGLPGCKEFDYAMGISLLKHVEWCSRISHRSEEAVTEDSWKKIIQHVVMGHGDWSVTEHAFVSVDMYVDRGITHELVRHRLFAFTQESTRFVNYEKKMAPSFVFPPALGEVPSVGKCPEDLSPKDARTYAQEVWNLAVETCEEAYKKIVHYGYPPQIARSVFPNALASRIIVTGNLRNWRHVLIMRTSAETHPQFKQVSIPLLREFQAKIPLLYDDIVPEQRQIEAMRRPR